MRLQVVARMVASSLSKKESRTHSAAGCNVKLTLGFSQQDRDKGLGMFVLCACTYGTPILFDNNCHVDIQHEQEGL